MTHPDLPYWLALTRVPRIGGARIALLEQHFGSLREAWPTPRSELQAAGLDDTTIRSLFQVRPTVEPEAELAPLEQAGVQAFTWHDPEYPPRLKEIVDRPPLLFVEGTIEDRDEWSVAVVGTRRVSAYGRQMAEELSRGLAANSVTVVSGLARGVDGVAHRAALEAGGRTIAVVASGLDTVYPPEHKGLAAEIRERGAIVSEQPLRAGPRADYFPRRNRILSGLTLGSLIIEAGKGSGALHTANHANEQNREVFAVPGRVTSPMSVGTNALIQQGMAKQVVEVGDILEELNLQMVERQVEFADLMPRDDQEAAILQHFTRDPRHIDEAVRLAGLPVATVTSTLAMLELRGLVRQVGPMIYVRN